MSQYRISEKGLLNVFHHPDSKKHPCDSHSTRSSEKFRRNIERTKINFKQKNFLIKCKNDSR